MTSVIEYLLWPEVGLGIFMLRALRSGPSDFHSTDKDTKA